MSTSTLPPAVFLIFALAAFAAAVGLFAWLVTRLGKGNDERRASRSSSASPGAEDEGSGSNGDQELLCVWRNKGGSLEVFVQGRRYRHIREITNPELGLDTVEAIKRVMAFAEGWLPSIQQQMASSANEGSSKVGTFLERLGHTPAPPPKTSSGPAPKVQRQEPGSMLDPLALVDEVDDLLQRRLQEHPGLAGRNIRLTTTGGGGLRVYVDQAAYDAIGDVPDPQIRALIQSAIQEWESRPKR
jgi:hypothetical protein